MTQTIQRAVGVMHSEAFQLMLYRSECGKSLWFWNSRDGVTPFGTRVDGVDYRHAMNTYRPTYSGTLPDKAEFVWVDYDRAAWVDMMTRKWEQFRDDKGPYGGEGFLAQFPTPESFALCEPYRGGEPRRLTREHFLAQSTAFVFPQTDGAPTHD